MNRLDTFTLKVKYSILLEAIFKQLDLESNKRTQMMAAISLKSSVFFSV